MEELSLDNILTEEQMNGLFSDEEVQEEKEAPSEKEIKEPKTTEIESDNLFGESESVGSEDKTGKEGTDSTISGTSPDFYSSMATALVEDGIFQNPDNIELSDLKTAEDFAEFVSNQVKNQFDERQKRIDEALNLGIEPTEIQRYENYLNILNGISEEDITKEGDEGENTRKNLIYQDYLNRGMSKERAMKYTNRSFTAGTDIEDAKEALQSNKEFFKDQYDGLIAEAREEEKREKEAQKKQAEEFKNAILESKTAFGEIELDKATRQKVYDSIAKPTYTDPKTGERLTLLQKYESENKTEFLKNLGLIFVLTDGFKKLDGLVGTKVKKEVKKGLRELEHTINSTARTNNGSLSFMSGVGDKNSKSSKWDLDI